jgi:hypothetical protein
MFQIYQMINESAAGQLLSNYSAVGTLREEKPYVHRVPYCEHTCYAQNRRMSV